MRIASISSSRADIGGLSPVWRALAEAGADLDVVLTGMHRAAGAPQPDGIPAGATVHLAGSDLGGRADAGASDAMADITRDCGRLFADLAPDAILVLGDRIDMIPAVIAALPFAIPVVHLHGGEVTEGAIDDRIRHAVTKLADLHCASSAGAAIRLAAMGVDPAAIVVTGAPGLDTLVAAPEIARAAFLAETGLAAIDGATERFALVTVHPETAGPAPLAPLEAVLEALDASPMPTLFTAPNSDPGGAEMKARIVAFVGERPFAVYRDTLGSRLYPNALRHAALMIGNSSSGIIEAGLFGLPVVDVGDRQKGRERGRNVVAAANTPASVTTAIATALGLGRIVDSPYGDGRAATAIANAISDRFDDATSARRSRSKRTAGQ